MSMARAWIGIVLVAMAWGCDQSAPMPDPKPRGPQPPAPPVDLASLPPIVEMGSKQIGPWQVVASRKQGYYGPGTALPVELRITGSDGVAPPRAVNVWIGYEMPARSRSELVDATWAGAEDPDLWRVTPAMPVPFPDGPDLWVRLVDEAGVESLGYLHLGG